MNDGILLNDSQVALNEAVLACDATAHRYTDGADMLKDDATDLSSWMAHAANARTEIANGLRETIRQFELLPQDDKSEKESLVSLVSHGRAAIANDRQAWVVKMCIESEQALQEALQRASPFTLHDAVEEDLKTLKAKVDDALTHLNDVLKRL